MTQAANLFRRLGVGPADAVAYILPNALETPVVLLAGATAGIVTPVNPLLRPEHIATILRDTGAKVVVMPPSVGGVKEVQNYLQLFDYDVNLLISAIKETGAGK